MKHYSVFSIFSTLPFRLLAILLGVMALPGLLTLTPVLAEANSVSIAIQSISATNIPVGTGVSFTVSASGFTNPTYSLADSFGSGSTISNSNINSSGNFSWTPSGNDVGTHTLTINVSDSSGDSATTTETLTVTPAPGISLQSLNPSSSVSVGTNVTFFASLTGFSNPTFSLSDSFSGSSLSSSNINSSGNFSWTPTSQDVGTHTITVSASDSYGHISSATETITVNSAPTVIVQSLSPGNTITVGQGVSFNVSVSGFNSPYYSVSDTFGGSSVSNGDINSPGNFSWTPNSNDAGTHTITVIVTDGSGHTATASQTIYVQSATVSIESLSPGQPSTIGTPITFTVSASGFSGPTYTVSDSFQGSTVSNADINSSGNFSWTPTSADFGSHDITVHVYDSSGHNGSVSQEITIENPSVSVESISPSQSISPGTTLTFTVVQSGFTNPVYTLADSFPGTTLSSSDINSSSGYFDWTPAESDSGSHNITIYASDSYGHSANTALTVNVGYTQAAITSSYGYTFTEYLVVGSSDGQVTALQTLLAKEGYFNSSITGYYGPITQTAVENFQTAHGVDPVGTVGPLTRNVLNELEGTTSAVVGTNTPGCTSGAAYSTTTGQPCVTTTVIPGCVAGNLYSTTTGQYCRATAVSSVNANTTTTNVSNGYQFTSFLEVGSTGGECYRTSRSPND